MASLKSLQQKQTSWVDDDDDFYDTMQDEKPTTKASLGNWEKNASGKDKATRQPNVAWSMPNPVPQGSSSSVGSRFDGLSPASRSNATWRRR